MKTNKIILLLLSLFFTFGCTKDIEFSGDEVSPFLIMEGHLTPNNDVKVRISKSRFSFSYKSKKELIVKDAVVRLYVNDKFVQKMKSVGEYGFYVSNYKPKVDEKIKITAEKRGFETIEATTLIPKAPVFHFKDTTELYYDDKDNWSYDGDTITKTYRKKTKIHFVLSDNLDTDNYYFYKGHTIAYYLDRDWQKPQGNTTWIKTNSNIEFNLKEVIPTLQTEDGFDDIFSSNHNDIEVYDGINYFSDKMVSKSTIDMYFPIKYLIGRRSFLNDRITGVYFHQTKTEEKIRISLSSMSKDLYLFVKSLEKARQGDSPFTEPVQIHSNVKNGAGILGSYNTTTHTIRTVNR